INQSNESSVLLINENTSLYLSTYDILLFKNPKQKLKLLYHHHTNIVNKQITYFNKESLLIISSSSNGE
ncbi:hypothetical protein J4732_20765, partial [Serratia marcescens]|nr:hypothetical protein [Serratia marcescens]